MILRAIWSIGLALVILAPGGAMVRAQTSSPPPAASTTQLLKPAELDQLVSPIALYPDPLLAEVLMASTYPLDVVEAERWLQSNKNLKDDALKAAADKQDWDASIKALLATPDVLDMMSSKLDWTQKLGDAVVAQQADVMDAIQRLRSKAQANNKLSSTKQQTVTVTKAEGGGQFIAIEPTDPNTVYVPYYDPAVVYGDWSYPEYPPYSWPAPSYIGAGILATGLAFGTGYALGRWAGGGNYWGGNVNWGNKNININRSVNGGGGANWKPNVDHRNAARNRGGRQQGGLNGRGSGGNQVINPGGNRGNQGGNRVNAGDNRGNPGGNRANAGGNRGNQGGNRANAGGNRGNQGDNRANAGGNRSQAAGNRQPSAGNRPSGGGNRHNAANRGNANRARPSGGAAHHRGAAGARSHSGGARAHAGGGMRAHGGGGRAGGMRGGGGGRGGGRRSDIRLKQDIVFLGYLNDGLGFYRFRYNGSEKVYVGVIAQEAQRVMPAAVARDRDGYLTVDYTKLGVPFESYRRWLRTGARIPSIAPTQQ